MGTYGGWGAHGGGAFSGKDPTKVDRSAAYLARQVAKSVVAAGLAARCIFQVYYAIGVPEPLSIFVDTYGTGSIPDSEILDIVKSKFDFRPGLIGKNLDLLEGTRRLLPTDTSEEKTLTSPGKLSFHSSKMRMGYFTLPFLFWPPVSSVLAP